MIFHLCFWFERIFYCPHKWVFQRRGRVSLFALNRWKQRPLAFSRQRRYNRPALLKNALRFELHFRFCFGKADVADKLRLEQQEGFGRNVRIAFFGTFFSKKKGHKGKRLQEIPTLMISARLSLQTSSVILSRKCHPPSSRRRLPSLSATPRRRRTSSLHSSLLTQKRPLPGSARGGFM